MDVVAAFLPHTRVGAGDECNSLQCNVSLLFILLFISFIYCSFFWSFQIVFDGNNRYLIVLVVVGEVLVTPLMNSFGTGYYPYVFLPLTLAPPSPCLSPTSPLPLPLIHPLQSHLLIHHSSQIRYPYEHDLPSAHELEWCAMGRACEA